MPFVLRPYQSQLKQDIKNAWAQGAKNVIAQLATGGGKTAVLSNLILEHNAPCAIIAHRHELVSQISLALARNGVHHNIIGSRSACTDIAREHVAVLGQSFYNPGSPAAVASVDTLVRRPDLGKWASQVTLWITDEGHHVVEDNKWHAAIQMFTHPDIRGLLPTATPWRADGKGLGRPPVGSGVADVMVSGPPMRWLIEEGYLCDFEVACPPSDLDLIEDVGASGDWSTKQLRDAVKRSHVVGDIVKAYIKLAMGRLGCTFTTDVETAVEQCEAFKAAGIPAATIFGKDNAAYRRQVLRKYENREYLQLVTVDIVSEGFDLPNIEVISAGRPTQSLSLYMQQFGRMLRPAPGKKKALYIDHAKNIIRHGGTPDKPRLWSLADREKKRSSGGIGLRTCLECWQPFERYRTECPTCGAPIPEPESRAAPEVVEGDLHLLSPEALAILRGQIDAVDMDVGEYGRSLIAKGVPAIGVTGHMNRLKRVQAAQTALRTAMSIWGGKWHAKGLNDRELQRAFYLNFGIDVMSAMGLNEADALSLLEKVVTNG